jgi:small subunit ribosomal protein S2
MPRMLLTKQQYLASGIHIGMKQRTKDMKEFIYKIRPDGLAVLNLRKIDERIRVAAKFLARQKNIIVVGRKSVAQDAIKKFGELVGAKVIVGRFMPGMLTNPSYKNYFEADVMLVVDPAIDVQALKEAVAARIPVVAFCDTVNQISDVDLVVPMNNKGKKSLATVFMLLAREVLKERNQIKSDSEFKYSLKDFGAEE